MESENRVSRKWLLPTSSDNQVDENKSKNESTQEDFDFGSALPKEKEMCCADEVFFQGRILPASSSSKSRSFCWSESMEDVDGDGGGGGRSCSNGSSSSSFPIYKPRIRNHFHSHHPSPKPQLRYSRIKNQNSKSTMWSHFRVGLLTTPKIELEDLKVRSIKSRSSSDQYECSIPLKRLSIKLSKEGSDSSSSDQHRHLMSLKRLSPKPSKEGWDNGSSDQYQHSMHLNRLSPKPNKGGSDSSSSDQHRHLMSLKRLSPKPNKQGSDSRGSDQYQHSKHLNRLSPKLSKEGSDKNYGNLRGKKSEKQKRQGPFYISCCKCEVNSIEIVPFEVYKRNEAKEEQVFER